ncbi:hypothetical protein AX14_011343, partial [Amanita brunnescens Koide BX004]
FKRPSCRLSPRSRQRSQLCLLFSAIRLLSMPRSVIQVPSLLMKFSILVRCTKARDHVVLARRRFQTTRVHENRVHESFSNRELQCHRWLFTHKGAR